MSMNEFTKEELIKIKDVMYGISFDDNEERILRKKIQSMIEDYNECKHTLTMTDTFVKCQDCKKVIEYDE